MGASDATRIRGSIGLLAVVLGGCPAPSTPEPAGTTEQTTAGTPASDDGTAGFLMMPDGGAMGECDVFAQDCAPGEKCTSYVTIAGQMTVDATRCAPVIGDDTWSEPCERMADNDTCAAGFFCMTEISGGTGPGTCLEYCSLDVPCQFGGECFPFNDGVLSICQETCDPLLQDCPAGEGCYSAFNNFLCAEPAAEGQDGDPCATVQACNPGLVCRNDTAGCPDDGACCTPLCELEVDECVDPAEECVPAHGDPAPGLEMVGYCGVPR